jgi:hypothetical protein
MEVDDALMESGYSFLDQGKEGKSLSFTVKGRDGTTLQSLTIPRASLVSEQVNSSSNGSLRLTLNYVGHSS